MDDGEESRRGEGRLCTHGLRHLWVARANPGPRTYVCTSRPSPARPTLYSARLERYRYPYLVASSRTSAPVTHRRSSDPLPGRTASSPRFTVLLRSLFPFSPSLSLSLSLSLFNYISFEPLLLYSFLRSSPIVEGEPSLHTHSKHTLWNR